MDALVTAVEINVRAALAEDVGQGDITAALVPADATAKARVVSRERAIFCGEPWVTETCRQVAEDIVVTWKVKDGEEIDAQQVLFELAGPARALLTAERTILNFAQLLSGTATLAQKFVKALGNSKARLLDTRKTLPGLRQAQKYAVRCGGGENHRMGLYDAFLIKENHIAAAGSIAAAIAAARAQAPAASVEVEVETSAQLDQAIEAGADVVMLDNFSIDDMVAAVARNEGRVKLEASGNIGFETLGKVAATGVDYISVGEITKRVVPVDLSMRFV